MTRPARAGVVVALGGALVTFAGHSARTGVAWLAAFAAGLAAVLGALVLAMVLEVVGARWWLPVRPAFMRILATIPVFVLLFVPVALLLPSIYPPAPLAHQRAWAAPGPFFARAALYFTVWTALALVLPRRRGVSAAGLPLALFTMTFAAFDWLMPLDPGWTSSAYGLYVFTSGLATAVALLALALPRLALPDPHPVGKLLLVSVMLWAYVGFFQFLIVWMADLPREATYFVARSRGGFGAAIAVLVVGRLGVPFFLLLSRRITRSARALAVLGGWLVVMGALDFLWLVMPAAGGRLGVLDAAPMLVVFGVVVAVASP